MSTEQLIKVFNENNKIVLRTYEDNKTLYFFWFSPKQTQFQIQDHMECIRIMSEFDYTRLVHSFENEEDLFKYYSEVLDEFLQNTKHLLTFSKEEPFNVFSEKTFLHVRDNFQNTHRIVEFDNKKEDPSYPKYLIQRLNNTDNEWYNLIPNRKSDGEPILFSKKDILKYYNELFENYTHNIFKNYLPFGENDFQDLIYMNVL